jgi:hypothetical protein
MDLLLLLAVHVLFIIPFGHAHILLYDTETNNIGQYFFCIHITNDTTMKYCRRWNSTGSFNLELGDECVNGGKQLLFVDLDEQKISPAEVLVWSSSVERADDYANFYYNKQLVSKNDSLCNCTRPGTFGLRCEFELLHEAITFEDAIESQFKQKKDDPWGIQRHGNILCYRPFFECDYGLLCLDWRNICDGAQHCIDGYDEENCDIIEFNECEDDEYRCANGMCIAHEYWLDGKSIRLQFFIIIKTILIEPKVHFLAILN